MTIKYFPLGVDEDKFLLVDEDKFLALAVEIDVCHVYQVILNERHYFLLPGNHYWAVRYCDPVNTLVCLGQIKGVDQIFYTFDLFKSKKEALFLLKGLNLNGSDAFYFKAKTIHQLPKIRIVNDDDYLYYFRNTMLYKISYEDFLDALSNITKCGELVGTAAGLITDPYFVTSQTSDGKILIKVNPYWTEQLNILQQQVSANNIKMRKLLSKIGQ